MGFSSINVHAFAASCLSLRLIVLYSFPYHLPPSQGLQVGTKELEEMGAKFGLGLLILQSKSFYSGTLHPQVEALLEAEREGADNHRR